tara:strand:+ start:1168 stop:1701 length:534 start_codon:yes stop_codon:yes gene_type:complete
MNALKSRLGMVPRMQGGGQPPPMPPMPQQPPPPVPAVGGGLPSIADNMRNSMPPARPMPAPPPQAPMPAPQEGGMAEVDQMLAGLDEDTRAGMMGTIEESETPEEMLPNAMASSVAAVSGSREEIIATFDIAKEKALAKFDAMMGPQAGMSEIDMGIMDLLGGEEEMAMADEINMLG